MNFMFTVFDIKPYMPKGCHGNPMATGAGSKIAYAWNLICKQHAVESIIATLLTVVVLMWVKTRCPSDNLASPQVTCDRNCTT